MFWQFHFMSRSVTDAKKMPSLTVCVQTKLYIEDWIGLRTLDEAGRVKFVSVPGGHLRISKSDMKKYIVPYLTPEASSKQNIRRMLSL